MKTYRLFGIAICTGTQAEMDGVDKLAAGTHFLTAYGTKQGGQMDKNGERWTGVDLDGTLAEACEGWPEPDQIGDPIEGMMEWVKRSIGNGLKIKIFTARAGWTESLPHVKEWLTKHGLGHLEVTNVKDMYCDRILDDKAIQVLRNSGLIVGIHPAGLIM
jgi:hypothetical protein